MAEIAMLKAVLPQELPDTGMILIDIYFKDDMVVYEFLIPEELWERTTFADPEYSHERLLAGKVATLPDEQLQKYKECKKGLKHI